MNSAEIEDRRLVAFSPTAGQLPEGFAVDGTGNVFVSLSSLGQLVVVKPGSRKAQPFGSCPAWIR